MDSKSTLFVTHASGDVRFRSEASALPTEQYYLKLGNLLLGNASATGIRVANGRLEMDFSESSYAAVISRGTPDVSVDGLGVSTGSVFLVKKDMSLLVRSDDAVSYVFVAGGLVLLESAADGDELSAGMKLGGAAKQTEERGSGTRLAYDPVLSQRQADGVTLTYVAGDLPQANGAGDKLEVTVRAIDRQRGSLSVAEGGEYVVTDDKLPLLDTEELVGRRIFLSARSAAENNRIRARSNEQLVSGKKLVDAKSSMTVEVDAKRYSALYTPLLADAVGDQVTAKLGEREVLLHIERID